MVDEDSMEEKKGSRWGRLAVLGVVWSMTALCVGFCGAWIFGGWLYWFDLAAGYTAQAGGVAVLVGSVWFVARHRRAGVVCFVSALIALWVVVDGRGVVVQEALVGQSGFLIGSYNIFPMNQEWEVDVQSLMQLDLDVLILQETPWQMNRAVVERGFLDEEPMPYWVNRQWIEGEVSWGLIFSKYPLELIEPTVGDGLGHHQLMCIVHAPDQRFLVVLMHPASPRSVERWDSGNRVVAAHLSQIERAVDSFGLPVIVGADLNSAPAQHRSRMMRDFGLRAGKPLFPVEFGSFPVGWPGIARIQLDDIWRGSGVGVVEWGMLELSGSDHMAVIGRFVFDEASDGGGGVGVD